MKLPTVFLEPGQFVRLEQAPEWGLGQVQSVDGPRVTVNFTDRGKVLVNTQAATLVPVATEER